MSVTMVANSRQALFGKLSHNGSEAFVEKTPIGWVLVNQQRRQNPDLFRIHRRTEVCGPQFTSMGNHFLLEWPDRQQVEISRSASDGQVEVRLESVLAAAHNGAVTYTAAISKGEQKVARTVREQGYPLVVLLNDGFPAAGSPQDNKKNN